MFNYLMSQITILVIHLLFIVTTYYYWSHINIKDVKVTNLDARSIYLPKISYFFEASYKNFLKLS